MRFQELTNKQWKIIEPHLPKPAHTGRPRSSDRTILNGIIYVLISGCRWSEMPKKYGDDSTANRRLNSWQQKGVWKKILKHAINSAHSSGKINLQNVSVDSSSVAAKKGEIR